MPASDIDGYITIFKTNEIMKSLCEYTITEFRNLPKRKFDEDIGNFDSLVILPTRRKHDSGYRCMEFVAVKGGQPICRMGGGSDVIHLLGMDGFNCRGKEDHKKLFIRRTENVTFNASLRIDCLPCGLLRIFCHHKLKAGMDLSSFELYVDETKEKK